MTPRPNGTAACAPPNAPCTDLSSIAGLYAFSMQLTNAGVVTWTPQEIRLYVNGEQVDETKLANGEQVQIGRFKLTFFLAGE